MKIPRQSRRMRVFRRSFSQESLSNKVPYTSTSEQDLESESDSDTTPRAEQPSRMSSRDSQRGALKLPLGLGAEDCSQVDDSSPDSGRSGSSVVSDSGLPLRAKLEIHSRLLYGSKESMNTEARLSTRTLGNVAATALKSPEAGLYNSTRR